MRTNILLGLLFFNFLIAYGQQYRSVEEAKGLAIGVEAPEFVTIDADSNRYSLKESLNSGPVVIIFYRGYWCPVCSRHLAKIQDSLVLIYETGASVVAVSPQKPEYLEKMRNKSQADFTLLYDEGFRISDDYDVTFVPETKQLFSYNTFLGANLKETQSDDSQRLPIPATYILNQEGIIIWRQFNTDYKKRSNVKDIVKALKSNL